MPNLFRDLARLEMYSIEDVQALERHGFAPKFADFFQYFGYRFVDNLKAAFSDFARSEILEYNKQHQRQIDLTFKNPRWDLTGMVIPVPKGMQKTYLVTFLSLEMVLKHLSAESLLIELKTVNMALRSGNLEHLPNPIYGKDLFDKDKKIIGALYSKEGLSYSSAEKVFLSRDEIVQLNTKLKDLVEKFYPQSIAMQKQVEEIAKSYDSTTVPDEQLAPLKSLFLDLAYRTGLFAIVLTHLSEMEHAFVKDLALFKIASDKH